MAIIISFLTSAMAKGTNAIEADFEFQVIGIGVQKLFLCSQKKEGVDTLGRATKVFQSFFLLSSSSTILFKGVTASTVMGTAHTSFLLCISYYFHTHPPLLSGTHTRSLQETRLLLLFLPLRPFSSLVHFFFHCETPLFRP